ncbi:MAG: peptidylprolyl isomerase [Gammaproteobacteria bacterium]|tara:strand:+ start:175 stop:1422 length:1248 start_codon:yes stop_codon:yes gene_type:complete
MKIYLTVLYFLFGILLSSFVFSEKLIIDKVAAIAGDGIILESELNKKYDEYLSNFQINNPNSSTPPEKIVREQILERLILVELQLQRAKRAGVRISDQELTQYIGRIAAANNLSLKDFIEKIKTDRTVDSFRKEIRQQLILSRVQRGLVGPKVFISDQELKNFIDSTEGQNLILVEYKIQEILVKSEKSANTVLEKLSSGDKFSSLVEEFNEAELLKEIQWVRLSQLPSLFADRVKNMSIDSVEGPIESGAGYHFLKIKDKRGDTVKIEEQLLARHILIQTSEIRNRKQATSLLEEIKKRIDDGEDFSVLARLYSDDPGTKLDGGDLGWSTSEVYDKKFKEVLDSSDLNEVSEPFESSFGFHILEVLDKRKKDISGELLENKAYRIIYDRKFDEQLDKTLQELRAESFVEIKKNT